MKKTVIAIGLDAAEPSVLEGWMSKGLLKNLSKLRERGAYGRIQNQDKYRAETPWTTFLTGVWPETTGYWGPVKYESESYSVDCIDAYKYEEYKPFYALNESSKVAIFDMPQTKLSPEVQGLQMLAWGAHSPQVPSQSHPASLFDEVIKKHGEHPAFGKNDVARIYDPKDVKTLFGRMQEGIKRRSAICRDWLEREDWDLFLTVFGESHSAGHYFWHTNQENHPMYQIHGAGKENYLLKAFQAIDQAIGEILEAAPEDASIVVFSAHGMQSNNMDVPSTFFLPEFLFRWNFPGEVGFENPAEAWNQDSTYANRGKWYRNVWAQRNGLSTNQRRFSELSPTPMQRAASLANRNSHFGGIVSPYAYKNEGGQFDWQPSSWYSPSWGEMKAFALPSFSEGYIRINLEGRDPTGVVKPEDYEAVCNELQEKLFELKSHSTGHPIVKQILRTRGAEMAETEGLPDADLIVIWNEDAVTDAVESPEVGKIGPVPFQRSGSHTGNGFVMIQTEGVTPNSDFAPGEAVDLAPTIMELMGLQQPDYFAGKPLVARRTPVSLA